MDDQRLVVGFCVRGPSELTARTLGYLAHVDLGVRIGPRDLPRIQQVDQSKAPLKPESSSPSSHSRA